MPIKPVIQGLAAVWLVLFVFSFISLQTTETDGVAQAGLARVAVFLTWQVIAFVVAMLGAFATRYAVARGVERVKAFGYVPPVKLPRAVKPLRSVTAEMIRQGIREGRE